MQKPENRNLTAACIRQAAHRHEIEILALEVIYEHMHNVFVLPKDIGEVMGVKILKAYPERKVFQVKERFLLCYPKRHFWSRGYMARSVGADEKR